MFRSRSRISLCALLAGGVSLLGLAPLAGCIEPITVEVQEDLPEAEVGEPRRVELRYLRFDVEGFEQSLDLADLEALPESTLDEVWLLDLELSPLVANALTQLRDLPIDEAAELPLAAQNMRILLRTTPDNIDLENTLLEELIALSASVGIPPAKALSDLLEVGVTEHVHDIESATAATVDNLIGSHPASQWRDGPVDDEHPDGQWPVAENSLPITLGDVVSNFADLTSRFGPVETEQGMHPGFIEEAEGLSVVEDEFLMKVKVNANALPYKGLDLTDTSVASVNSTASQIDGLFPVEDPDWMEIEGLVEQPLISLMTVTMIENPAFMPGGTSREPAPLGNSPAWDLPQWEFEHLAVDMSKRVGDQVSSHCTSYELGTGVEAFRACVDETGWTEIETFNDVGNPPAPSYLWDLELEIAQVRLHDGLAEGEADVQFTLTDVPIGISSDEIVSEIRENLGANPAALKDLASAITNSTEGFADFYYYRPDPAGAADLDSDWLYFIAEDDIPHDDDGPVRTYGYLDPGFYADRDLTQKVSDTAELDGDDVHEKVRIEPGDVLFMRDDEGKVFEITVAPKPSPNRIALDIVRLD